MHINSSVSAMAWNFSLGQIQMKQTILDMDNGYGSIK
jgi:hypothetical protein